MKPIGLVTCYFHHNYGSMLQAYATEMIFQKMNLPYQTISCKSPIVYMQGNKLLYIIKKILIADWKMRIGKIKIEYGIYILNYTKINREKSSMNHGLLLV